MSGTGRIASPEGDVVELWRLPLDRPPAELVALERTLSLEERARAARLRAPRDRARLIARRALVRRVLAEYLRVPPSAIRLRTGWAGRPELDAAQRPGGLMFNVTCSGGLALCAVACERPVGVDLELAGHAAHLEGAASDVLDPVEHEGWSGLPAAQRGRMLLAAFCAKEAVLKARGEGLTRPLPEIVLRFADGAPTAVREIAGEPGAAARWRVRTLDLGSAYVGALATAGGAHRVRPRALA